MAGPVTIDWGDGTPTQDGPEQGEVTHQYAEGVEGEQVIKVCSKEDPSACTEVTFTPGGGEEPAELKVTASEDTADLRRMTVKAVVDNTGQGPVSVDWGDGSVPVDAPETGEVAHEYPRAGSFTVTVTDADDASRKGTATVTVPFGPVAEPLVEAVPSPDDATGRTVEVTYSGFPQGTVSIDWGDGSEVETGAPAEGTASHAYGPEVTGEQTITVTSEADSSFVGEDIFAPKPEPSAPAVEAVPSPDDATGRTVEVTYSGFPQGTVSIDWGDGSEVETGAPAEGTASHAYGPEVTGEQTITVTSEADGSKTATATFIPQPVEPSEPTVQTATAEGDETGRTVEITYAGFPEGAVTVDWGDESQTEEVQGPEGTATHAYAETVEGEQTISLTSVEDDSKTATGSFIPGGQAPAGPELTSETATDNPRSVTFTATNLAGETATFDYGDDSATEDKPVEGGQAVAEHIYPEAAEATDYTATVTADGASAETTVTIAPAGLRSTSRRRGGARSVRTTN